MTEVFLGQIMLTGFSFAPKGFALCNGQLLPVAQNQALFSLLGTMYGGNGTTNFALPNMQSRTPVGAGNSADSSWNPEPYNQGGIGGVESVTLLNTQIPPHNHQVNGTTTAGTARNPTGGLYGTNGSSIFGPANGTPVPLQGVGPGGGNQPHPNLQPYTVINFVIALSGIYPSRD
ncbi:MULTISPECIES: tail fiber protein [Stenotrophomonas]|uniref:Microcystin-dependent protein n=1 Tax=Stenotrophomonas humi TaxID=405444 RepID=A0A0R0C543_9GAMM|nr:MULTISPECIES: tail fiber protein [Stenotrophomonas]KRG64278.1 microcystin-dependent protein [Stenotrophomonas humi]